MLLAAGAAVSAQAQASPAKDSAAAPVAPAALVGHVTDTSGVPLAGAEISLFHAEAIRAITGDSGEFHIAGLPPGTNVFNVRRLGFEAASFTAVLRSGKTGRATFKLSSTALALPTIAVTDTVPKTHWLDQFERRKSSARGIFITRPEIERRNARTGTDIVRNLPGIRTAPSRNGFGTQILMTRTATRPCAPTMFVHNTPYSGTMDDFTADDIEAVEVYVGVSEIPAELDKNGKGICGVIVVWTRDPGKKQQPPGGG
jgi:carboxypeptidase family protein/TonB-dependent receptor-like protein